MTFSNNCKEEHPNKIVLEGKLCLIREDEDAEIGIGNRTLYNALYEYYLGKNVKITVEIIPDKDEANKNI